MSTAAITSAGTSRTTRRRTDATRRPGRARRVAPVRTPSPLEAARGARPVRAPLPVPQAYVAAPRPVRRPVVEDAHRPAVRPAPSVAPAGQLRLTRRGRLVVAVVMLTLVLAAFAVSLPHSAATDRPGAPVPTRTVEVGPGDTLWEIAADVAAPGQVRDMVQRIEDLNALSGAGLAIGQEIAVPLH